MYHKTPFDFYDTIFKFNIPYITKWDVWIHDLEYYTNGNVSESRDKSGKLNYLKGNDKLNSILNCDVVDVSNSSNNKGKLEYFIKKIN